MTNTNTEPAVATATHDYGVEALDRDSLAELRMAQGRVEKNASDLVATKHLAAGSRNVATLELGLWLQQWYSERTNYEVRRAPAKRAYDKLP